MVFCLRLKMIDIVPKIFGQRDFSLSFFMTDRFCSISMFVTTFTLLSVQSRYEKVRRKIFSEKAIIDPFKSCILEGMVMDHVCATRV